MSGAMLPTTYSCDGCGKNQPTLDGARGALLPFTAAFRLRDLEARWELDHVVGRWVKVLAECLEGASRWEELAPLDCPITTNRPEVALERAVDLSTMSNGSTPLWTILTKRSVIS